ncbi:hypothetical protein RINTHM_11820 [Richelia intracellularis HM01]|uniref:Tic20 family protein n=1 Tax=Richelia intracellularis TaxID=1164990 RepID=UPI0002B5D8A4|nr:Tic20 family protein [Richelia intracellularis]CCH65642.1 hypothetical protein RINTHM_11820 [Richelia intracellularis HM01]
MTWRGSTTTMERVFASLPYLLPLVEVFKYGSFLMTQLPILGVLFLPILPLLKVYYGVRYAGLLVFFALFTLVVRSERIGHFIRFNTMQAILLDISIFLFGILMDLIRLVSIGNFAVTTLSTTVFLGIIAAAIYSVTQSLMGRYAEIPAISDAVHMQVR